MELSETYGLLGCYKTLIPYVTLSHSHSQFLYSTMKQDTINPK